MFRDAIDEHVIEDAGVRLCSFMRDVVEWHVRVAVDLVVALKDERPFEAGFLVCLGLIEVSADNADAADFRRLR